MDVTHINVIFQVLRGRFWLCLQAKQLSQQQVNVHYLLAIPGVQKTGRARLVSPASSKTRQDNQIFSDFVEAVDRQLLSSPPRNKTRSFESTRAERGTYPRR